jgi:hypothetical protein
MMPAILYDSSNVFHFFNSAGWTDDCNHIIAVHVIAEKWIAL